MGIRGYKEFLQKRYAKDRKNKYLPESVRLLNTRDFNTLVYRLHDIKNKLELYQKLNDSLHRNIVQLLNTLENENIPQK